VNTYPWAGNSNGKVAPFLSAVFESPSTITPWLAS
jgi:hypothetical protein